MLNGPDLLFAAQLGANTAHGTRARESRDTTGSVDLKIDDPQASSTSLSLSPVRENGRRGRRDLAHLEALQGGGSGLGMSQVVDAVEWREQGRRQQPRTMAARRQSETARSTVAAFLQTSNHDNMSGRCAQAWGSTRAKNGEKWLARTAATREWIWHGHRRTSPYVAHREQAGMDGLARASE